MNKSEFDTTYGLFEPLHPLSIWLKLTLLLFVAIVNKSTPIQPTWAVIMVLFAALILIPIAFQELKRQQTQFLLLSNDLIWHLPCTFFLAISFILDRSNLAGVLAIPYATWCVDIFIRGLKLKKQKIYWAVFTCFGFLGNASLWLVFDRFGIQPLGFSHWVVILTGVHFHFAGFTLLASLTLFLCQNPSNKFIQATILSVIVGVVLTAIGITATQLGFGQIIETFAGVWMAISGIFAGCIFIKNSLSVYSPTKLLWFWGGLSLILGMSLATLYALRSIIPIEILSISFMQAFHGSFNALGFGTLILLGWAVKKK